MPPPEAPLIPQFHPLNPITPLPTFVPPMPPKTIHPNPAPVHTPVPTPLPFLNLTIKHRSLETPVPLPHLLPPGLILNPLFISLVTTHPSTPLLISQTIRIIELEEYPLIRTPIWEFLSPTTKIW